MKTPLDFAWYPQPAEATPARLNATPTSGLTVEEIRALIREEIARDRAIRSARS